MSFGDKNFTYGPRIVKDGLVFYMDAANPKSYVSGSTTCNDLVSTISGTLENGTGFSTENNGSWSFDGSDDKIELTSGLDFTTVMSISCWVKVFSYNVSSWSGYITKRAFGGIGTGESYNIGTNGPTGGRHNFWVFDTTYRIVGSDDIISIGDWTNVTGTADGSFVNLYINGVKQSSTTAYNGSITTSTSLTRIGFNNVNLDGEISNIEIHNRALSQTEITQNYNALKGRFGL